MTVLSQFVCFRNPAIRIYGSVGKRPVKKGHARAYGCCEATCKKQKRDPKQGKQAVIKKPRLVVGRTLYHRK